MIDRGSGTPVVLDSGHSGTLGVDAPGGRRARSTLPRDHVLALRRADERFRRRPASRDRRVRGADRGRAAAARTFEQAIVIGVSYSGLIATEFAARHPERVLGLVLVSALPPGWTPDRAREVLHARAAAAEPALLRRLAGAHAPGDRRGARRDGARCGSCCDAAVLAIRARVSPSRMAQPRALDRIVPSSRIRPASAHRRW